MERAWLERDVHIAFGNDGAAGFRVPQRHHFGMGSARRLSRPRAYHDAVTDHHASDRGIVSRGTNYRRASLQGMTHEFFVIHENQIAAEPGNELPQPPASNNSTTAGMMTGKIYGFASGYVAKNLTR